MALLSWAESVRSTADRKRAAAVTSASEEEEYDREGWRNGPKLTFKSQSLAMNGSLAVTTWKPGTNTWQKGRWKWKVNVLITQSCLTFCDPMARLLDPWNSPARILEWVAIPSPRNLLDPGIKPRSPALQADSWLSEQPGKPNEEYTEVFLRKTCRTMESKSSTVINLHELEQCFLTSGCGLGAFFQLRISTGSPLPRFCLLGHLQVASLGFPIWEIANIVFLSPTFWN